MQIIGLFKANGPIRRTIFDRRGRLSPTFSQNDISNRIGRVSLTREIDENDLHSAPKQSRKAGHPYLDEEGNICQDKMEVMQHIEYDTQIHCEVFNIFLIILFDIFCIILLSK